VLENSFRNSEAAFLAEDILSIYRNLFSDRNGFTQHPISATRRIPWYAEESQHQPQGDARLGTATALSVGHTCDPNRLA